MAVDILEKVKRLTIIALLSDELLMGLLVLKGGNAIDIAYDLSSRGSIDIDFSMDRDFTAAELNRVRNQASGLLNNEFNKEGLQVFDVNLMERPKKIRDEVRDFWGGYNMDFKLIETEKYEQHKNNIDALRRFALPVGGKGSTKFEVDISKYEYVTGKRKRDLDGLIIYVYSPEMLALEKFRALCQQNPDYRKVVLSMTPKSRGRDFYDIHNLVTSFSLDLTVPENLAVCKHIFEAKRVPLHYLAQLSDQYDLHKNSWDSVKDTVNQKEELKDFDYYFGFVIDLANTLLKSL
jgi:predicted nucleotidyltransferase component of viral defense system